LKVLADWLDLGVNENIWRSPICAIEIVTNNASRG